MVHNNCNLEATSIVTFEQNELGNYTEIEI